MKLPTPDTIWVITHHWFLPVIIHILYMEGVADMP